MSPFPTSTEIPRVPPSAGADSILKLLNEAGGVIIQNLLTPAQVQALNQDFEEPLNQLQAGSSHDKEYIKDFHGAQTKRLGNVCMHSKTFRDEVLDHELVHQVIEIAPGNKAQILHRDSDQYPGFRSIGSAAPELVINALVALSPFTDENGGTRVIPGSHKWPDFSVLASPDETIACEMEAGDALLISGKVIHGGGANRTSNEKRRALALSLNCSFLTPEEAYPFRVTMDVARTMSPRAQRMIGFRSQYPKGSPGLWQADVGELANALGLDGVEPALQKMLENATM